MSYTTAQAPSTPLPTHFPPCCIRRRYRRTQKHAMSYQGLEARAAAEEVRYYNMPLSSCAPTRQHSVATAIHRRHPGQRTSWKRPNGANTSAIKAARGLTQLYCNVPNLAKRRKSRPCGMGPFRTSPKGQACLDDGHCSRISTTCHDSEPGFRERVQQ